MRLCVKASLCRSICVSEGLCVQASVWKRIWVWEWLCVKRSVCKGVCAKKRLSVKAFLCEPLSVKVLLLFARFSIFILSNLRFFTSEPHDMLASSDVPTLPTLHFFKSQIFSSSHLYIPINIISCMPYKSTYFFFQASSYLPSKFALGPSVI